MIDIELPVKWDDIDQSIVDARGRVVCIVGFVEELGIKVKRRVIGAYIVNLINQVGLLNNDLDIQAVASTIVPESEKSPQATLDALKAAEPPRRGRPPKVR